MLEWSLPGTWIRFYFCCAREGKQRIPCLWLRFLAIRNFSAFHGVFLLARAVKRTASKSVSELKTALFCPPLGFEKFSLRAHCQAKNCALHLVKLTQGKSKNNNRCHSDMCSPEHITRDMCFPPKMAAGVLRFPHPLPRVFL